MIAPVLVMLVSAGMCAAGALEVDMYFVGVVFFGIGAIGFLVWSVERLLPLLLRWLWE